MTGTSSTLDRRDDKARFLLASAGQWLKVRTKDGRPLAYGIPSASRPGVVHLANATRCTCEDSQWGHHCYHSRAVALAMEALFGPWPTLAEASAACRSCSPTFAAGARVFAIPASSAQCAATSRPTPAATRPLSTRAASRAAATSEATTGRPTRSTATA